LLSVSCKGFFCSKPIGHGAQFFIWWIESLTTAGGRLFRKTLVFIALLAPLALTQSSGTAASTRRRSIPGGVRSMKGCLQKDNDGSYYLLSQRGTRIALEGAEDFSTHLGQQVKASGAFVDTKEEAADQGSTTNQNAAGKLHPEHNFRVIKIDVLAQTCPAGKKK